MVAWVLMFITNSKVALKRIEHYSLCEERKGDEVENNEELPKGTVEVVGGNFTWESEYSKAHSEREKAILNDKKKKPEEPKLPKSEKEK